MTRPRHIEDDHQKALFTWAASAVKTMPALEWLYANPNGGKRNPREAARMKGQGVKPGAPDICLPIARGEYHGLYIEMKKPVVKGDSRPRVSPEQRAYIDHLNSEGYLASVCYGWLEARAVLISYLSLEKRI
jgi:hypothetical protein